MNLSEHEAIKKVLAYRGELAKVAGIDRVMSPHKIRHLSITALLDLNGNDVRSAQAHSRHKNLSTLIRYFVSSYKGRQLGL